MRRPSTHAELYAWWTLALEGKAPPRIETDPKAGWYRIRKARGGSWVPASITCKQVICPDTGDLLEPERMVGEVNGIPTDPIEFWLYAQPITQGSYDILTAMRLYTPGMIDERAPVDLARTPIGPLT